ncbi:MAG: DUF5309 family protein [Actinomycetota bacterium]
MDEIGKAMSDIRSKFGSAETLNGPVARWLEEEDYPDAVTATLSDYAGTPTLTISGNLQNAAVSKESIRRCIRVGTILERQSDGAQLKVSSVAGIDDAAAPWVCTGAAYGNSTLSNDGGAVTWDILHEVWSDFKDADETRMLTRTTREVGSQICAETFEIGKTRENTSYEIVGDETEHQVAALIRKMRRQEAKTLLRMRPYYNAGFKFGNATEEPTLCGLFTWPIIVQAEAANTNVYKNLSGGQLYKSHLDDLAEAMWLEENAEFQTGDWWIVCHPKVHKQIHDFDNVYREMTKGDTSIGFKVSTFDAKIGKAFPIVSDQYVRPDVIGIVNFKNMKVGYYANDKFDRKELQTQGRYRRWLVSWQVYGVIARKPRQIGMIYGAATS